jgi:ketosteroid isomerase-like protein
MQQRLLGALVAVTFFLVAHTNTWAQSADKQAVTNTVERFLTTLGNGDLEALPAMFFSQSSIAVPAQVDGKRTMSCATFDSWISARMAANKRTRFREPVNHFTVHVDGDLAFVRADANFIVEGEVRSNNIDYFTLVRVGGAWKFVNASFVSKPPAQN